MHIFLDESGPFLPLGGVKERVSLVGGLVLPTYRLADIYGEYLALRPTLRFREGEPKGSAQGEHEVASVIALLSRHDALLQATCIDAGFHSSEQISGFQVIQAALVGRAPPAQGSPETVAKLNRLAQIMRELPPQLFIQCMLYINVVDRLIRTAPLYYVQRAPRELGVFSWVVDRKGRLRTPLEELWQELILPILQTQSATDPMPMLAGADYSHFAPFEMRRPGATGGDEAPGQRDNTVVDSRALFKNQLRFEDSRDELGLELVDIAISALTRALNGSLAEEGWRDLGTLMIYQEPQSLRFVHFSPDPVEQGIQRARATKMAEIVASMQKRGKSMLSDDNIRMLLREPRGS